MSVLPIIGKGSGYWPTPTVAEATKIPAQANYGQIGLNNHPRIRGLPTREKMGKKLAGFDGGTSTRRTWLTPKCHSGGGQMERQTKGGGLRKLEDQISQELGRNTGALNPDWVEWLMGWPLGWTDLKPLATDRFRQWQHSHGISCTEESEIERNYEYQV